MKSIRQHPYRFGLMIWLLFVAVFNVVFLLTVHIFWLIDVLIAMNCAAFCTYGFDKLLAVGHQFRIPEKVLWFSAFTGGPFGAAIGMQVFRHKVSKTSFQFWLALTVLAEVGVVLFILNKLGILVLGR